MGSRSVDLDVDAAAIEEVAKALEVPLAPSMRDSLALWLAELVRWNKAHDLTAARSKDELLDLMLADALVLSRMIARDVAVVDVGSGAGAPGLPLSILRPDLAVTLVEPLQKRVGFLRLVLGTLDRLDVKLEAKRGDALPEGAWDVAISRATLAPDAWLALGTRLVKPGGEVVLLLARDTPPVREGWAAAPPVEYVWPRTLAVRSAVTYR